MERRRHCHSDPWRSNGNSERHWRTRVWTVACGKAAVIASGKPFSPSTTAISTSACVQKVLVPELQPGPCVILDNLSTHHNTGACKAMREAGCWFLFLPPYSPDLNPIEQAFSKRKAHLWRIGARSFTQIFTAIGEICEMFSPQECWNYLHAAGYGSI